MRPKAAWPRAGGAERRRARISRPSADHSEAPMRAPPERNPENPPAAGFLQVMGAVFWSFFGVRKRTSGERDAVTIKPVHVILAGLLGAAVLVAAVATLVAVVTRRS